MVDIRSPSDIIGNDFKISTEILEEESKSNVDP